jgi:hypothetical protein
MIGVLLAASVAASKAQLEAKLAAAEARIAELTAFANADAKLADLTAIAKAAEEEVDLRCGESAAWIMDHADNDASKNHAFAMIAFYSGRLSVAAPDIDWNARFVRGMAELHDGEDPNARVLLVCLPQMTKALPHSPN